MLNYLKKSINTIFTFLKDNFHTIFPAAIALITFWFSDVRFRKEKKFENQRLAFSKVRSLGNSYAQSQSLLLVNQLEMAYLKKALEICKTSHDSLDYTRFRDKEPNLLQQNYLERKELLEMISLAEISFEEDKELQLAIDTVLSSISKQIIINQFPPTISTCSELDKYFTNVRADISNKIHTFLELNNKLIGVLKRKIM